MSDKNDVAPRNKMRAKRYFRAVALLVVLRVVDLCITHVYTPDLANEWNPVISVFKSSWIGLIVSQLAIVLFISALMYCYFFRKAILVKQQNLSFPDFIYVYFYDKLKPWPQRFFSFPTKISRHLICNGFLFMMTSYCISCFAIIHNLLLIFAVSAYQNFVATYYTVYFPLVFIVAVVLSFQLFFIREYSKYKRIASLFLP